MTELAVRTDQQLDVPTGHEAAAVQLAQWAQAADAAFRLAQSISSTSFAPAAYRGKPEEACAAILAGAEVGLSPMASLRAFDNIQGTPAPKAITLRAIVQSLGHKVEIVESDSQHAIVRGLRKGETDWQVSTWDLDRATTAGYVTKNPKYKTNPAEMFVARATAEICRWVASDAIMGMPYTVEEIRDEGGSFEGRPQPVRLTAAEILSSTEIEPAPEPAHPRDLDTDGDGEDRVTEAQKRRIFAELNKRGVTDRSQRLAGFTRIVGREITSTNQLTEVEANQVIDHLTSTNNTQESAA